LSHPSPPTLHGNTLISKIAVEHLESKSDLRYKYFNNKIQTLIKRKVVLEEMEKASKKKLDS
jgi:hypothetical protein